MSEWAPSFIVDGSKPTSTDINTTFSSLRATVNDLDRNALRRGALGRDIAPIVIPSGAPEVVSHSDTQSHTYSDAVIGAPIRWAAFATNGATDRSIIGGAAAGGSNPPSAQLTFNGGSGYLLAQGDSSLVEWIYLMFNIEIANIVDANTDVQAMICLQISTTASGVWYTLGKTERLIDRDSIKQNSTQTNERMWYDCPIRAAVTSSTIDNLGLDHTTDAVTGVRAMCSIRNGTAGGSVLHLASFRLSGIPILSKMNHTVL